MHPTNQAYAGQLTRPERRDALRELKRLRRNRYIADRRSAARHECKNVAATIDLRLRSGDALAVHAEPHSVSEDGIAFLHGAYIPIGALCCIELASAERRSVSARGKVARCNHVSGRVREVGITFSEPLDLSEFFA